MAQLDRGTMCIMCQTLPLSQPNAQRHPYLKPIRRVDDADEQSTESLYHCTVCQTHWLYQRNKWDVCLGFKLWQGACRHLTGGMYRLSSPLRVQPARKTRCTRVLSCSLEPC